MTDERRPKDLDDAVARRRARRDRWRREGERPLAENLAMAGALGWLIVVPTLVGTFVGRWLDRLAGTGVTLTCAFMFLGLVAGGSLAWKRIRSE